MTKEELEEYENKIVMQEKSKLQKEAENYLNQNCKRWEFDSLCVDDIAIENYLAGAEPREKRIEKLEQQLSAMEKGTCDVCKVKDAEFYEKRIAELEAQIEKMKCCENCGWYYLQQHWRESKEINESRMFHCGTCGNRKNWKPKEIKEK